jgi:TRAP transporter TAXI family solute receptor
MKIKVRLISIFACVCVILLLSMIPSYSAEYKLSEPFNGTMGTASAVGGIYLMGGGTSAIVSKYVDGLTITPQVTGGGVDNIRLLANKEVDMMSLSSFNYPRALLGLDPFTQKYEDMFGLYIYSTSAVHVVVAEESDIYTFEDFAGKRVAVGPPGSTTTDAAKMIFERTGIADEVDQILMAYAEMYDSLKDNTIDGFVLSAGVPAPALAELARIKPIRLIEFDDELLDELIENEPGYVKGSIKPGTYYGVDEPVSCPNSLLSWVCRSDFPDEVAYYFVKVSFEHLDEIRDVSPGLRELSLDNAIAGWTVPLHPGALRYYREVGLVK